MEIQSNGSTSQQEIYAGVAAAGLVGGAALAVGLTSDVYKKKKTTPTPAKDSTASQVADEVLESNIGQQQTAATKLTKEQKKMNKNRVSNIDDAYDMALQQESGNRMAQHEQRVQERLEQVKQKRVDDHNLAVWERNNARVENIKGPSLATDPAEIAQVQQQNMNRAANTEMLKQRRASGTPKKKSIMDVFRRKIR